MLPTLNPVERNVNHLAQTLEALGFAGVLQEPEVLSGKLAAIQAKSLAAIIAKLVNENEPLLKATVDGTVLAIDERGGPGGFVVTVAPAVAAQRAGRARLERRK